MRRYIVLFAIVALLVSAVPALAVPPVHVCDRNPTHPQCQPTPLSTPEVAPTATPSPTATPTATVAPSPTAAPSAAPSPTPTPAPSSTSTSAGIYMGVHENVGDYWTDHTRFRAFIDDLRASGFDSISFGNGRLKDTLSLAAILDEKQMPYVSSFFQAELIERWYPTSVSATIENARQIVGPLIDALAPYKSQIGYNLRDDADQALNDKFRLAIEVIRERDSRPASPMIQRGRQGDDVYKATRGDAFLFYSYPCRRGKAEMSWVDFWVGEIRTTIQSKPAHVPVWQVIQAHQTMPVTDMNALRYPTLPEMRAQVWIALGEGAKGLFWFMWGNLGHEHEWTGLRDNTTLRPEAQALARRVTAVESVLGSAVKVADAYTAPGAYTSTLAVGSSTYVIAVNRSASQASIAVSGSGTSLRNVETGAVTPMGSSITFRGGDGQLFEVLHASSGTAAGETTTMSHELR
jgi:hypothetical protein